MTSPDSQSQNDTANNGDAQAASSAEGGEDRAGTDLSREALEAELRRARDDAAKFRAKSRFALPDEESFRRATEALSMLDKAEQDKKSVEQQLTERNEQLQYRAAESEKNLMKLRVALGAGVETSRLDEFASRLRGDTEEEMRNDAGELARLFAPSQPERRGDPSQGAGAGNAPVGNSLQAALESKLGISR